MTKWHPDASALSRPVYLSLADQVQRAITQGQLAVGDQLPTHRQLADELGISVQTVSRAYEELIRRGLISGETGRGTFIRAAQTEVDPPYIPQRTDEVIDLSIHGARLSTYSALRKGMSIWLTLPEVGPVGAEVMWADDFAAGCRFDAPLDPAAFEQLLRREGHVAAH